LFLIIVRTSRFFILSGLPFLILACGCHNIMRSFFTYIMWLPWQSRESIFLYYYIPQLIKWKFLPSFSQLNDQDSYSEIESRNLLLLWNYKNASIMITLGTNIHWTIAFSLEFPVSMATGDISKLLKITILRWFFCQQNWFQCSATSQWIEIESRLFSVGYSLH
jgi:hypothetical protein